MIKRFLPLSLFVAAIAQIAGCSMKEEIRRIEAVKQAREQSESSRSTDLTGEQIFIRNCNTCHPGGRKGGGPSLVHMDEHFKSDAELVAFLRKGKGNMPPQPSSDINDKEMEHLVDYLHRMNQDLKDEGAK